MVCYYVWDGGGSEGLQHTDVWKQLRMDHRPVRQRVGRRGRKSAAWEERGWRRKKRRQPVELGKGSCVSLLDFKF